MTDEAVHTVNRVVASLEKLVDLYADWSDSAETAEVTNTLRELQEDRANHLRRLTMLVQAQGELPKVPDPDAEFIEKMFAHVYGIFKDVADVAYLERALAGEEKLLDLVDETLRLQPPESVKEGVEELSRSTPQAISRLKASLEDFQ